MDHRRDWYSSRIRTDIRRGINRGNSRGIVSNGWMQRGSAVRFTRVRTRKNKNHRARRAFDRFTDGWHASPVTSKARDVVEISWNEISRPARRAVLPGPTSTIALHGKKREREREKRKGVGEARHGPGSKSSQRETRNENT